MAEEYFDVVNENNEVIGRAKRNKCHEKNLIHRAVIIFIFNDKGELLLQKRSKFKDLYRGYWTGSASGHLSVEESYTDAAKRELKEELGIQSPLKQSFFVKLRQKIDSENIKLFIGKSEGPFNFNKKEIKKIDFFPMTEIKKMIKKGKKFTPAFLLVFKTYLEKNN